MDNVGTLLGVWLLRLFSRLPRPITGRAGFLLGDVARMANRKRREFVRINLRICFPELSESERGRLLVRHFRAFGRTLLDLPLVWDGRTGGLVDIDGEEYVRAARAAGHPIILLTGHGLALDMTGIALARRHPMATMANHSGNPVIDRLMYEARSRAGRVHMRSDGIRPVVRSLREGLSFYYMPDEDLKVEQNVFAPFFGVAKATLPAPGRLARLARAVVIPCYGYWLPDDDRYLMKIRPPLEGFPSGDDEADAARMNAILEEMVRERPEQYMWTLKLFHSRPDGGLSPYRGGDVKRL